MDIFFTINDIDVLRGISKFVMLINIRNHVTENPICLGLDDDLHGSLCRQTVSLNQYKERIV